MDETALISKVGENWDFYLGDQWKSTANRQVNTGGMNLPSLNIIKPTVKFQVSTIAQNSFIPTFNDPTMKYPNEDTTAINTPSTTSTSSATADRDSRFNANRIEYKYYVTNARIILFFNNYPVYI